MSYLILIVEDDSNIAKYIQSCLSIGGYSSETCADGQTAVEKIQAGRYDLVLLDIMLPKLDGFEVMERIKGGGTPVIYLTALQDVPSKVRGLKSGVDDYIVKPFEALELLARVDLVMKRYHKTEPQHHYGKIQINIEKHTVQNDGVEVSLTPKEFDVFIFFVQHQNIVITRERLLSAIWDDYFTGETRTVDTHVQQVRKKLNLQGQLITVPKYGYKLLGQGE